MNKTSDKKITEIYELSNKLVGKTVKKIGLRNENLTIVFDDGTAIQGVDREFGINTICIVPPRKPNYKEAFNIIMNYWDSLPDEEKPKINRKLKKVGL